MAPLGKVSNCATSSRPTRTSRRIRRAESFASNFLRNAVHLAHVSVPGRCRDWPWSRQTSNRRSQCWIRLEERSISVLAIVLIHKISTGNLSQPIFFFLFFFFFFFGWGGGLPHSARAQ